MVAFLIPLLIAIAVSIVSYLIMPKPKQPKPEAAKSGDTPTAEAGREIPVIFGTVTIKDPNVLDYADKYIVSYEVKA
jgi:hypothetical protein